MAESKTNMITFPKGTYSAKLMEVFASGLHLKIAGTLEGVLDFAIIESDGNGRTYNITCEEAVQLASALSEAVQDVYANCLYDKDKLLERGTRKDK